MKFMSKLNKNIKIANGQTIPAGTNVSQIRMVRFESAGMNAGGPAKVVVRDDKGNEFVVSMADLQ